VGVLVVNHITLDGVLQGPGRPDEDTRDGFRHGGWAQDGASDPAIGAALGQRMGDGFSWLFGRRSYEGMLSHWNEVGGPFKDGLNHTHKYVATSNADLHLPWPNSTPLSGDVPAAVAGLRAQSGGNLVIMGSGQLIRSLLAHGLVDEMFLMIHPIVLGSGRRLFGSSETPVPLTLIDSAATSTGVTMATYRP
jgi:dihydrofolate reductase